MGAHQSNGRPVPGRGAARAPNRPGAAEATVGIIANPMSGRDIRRLVARASVFPNAEKANMVQRMLTAAGAVGVSRVLLSTDVGGISAAVLRAVTAHRQAHDRHAQTGRAARRPGRTSDHQPWPDVSFVGFPITPAAATGQRR